MNESKNFVVYDYMAKEVKKEKEVMAVDCFESFGWELVSKQPSYFSTVVLNFRRDKDLKNSELDTLQREMEKAFDEIHDYEIIKNRGGRTSALVIGVIGALILGGGMSLVTFAGSMAWFVAGIIIGVIGLAICGINIPILRKANKNKSTKIGKLIDEKQDEITAILIRVGQNFKMA